MRIMIKNYMFLAIGLILFMACDKEESTQDVIPPSSEIIMPQTQTTYYRGNTLMFTANFKDDIALKECTVYLSEQLKATRGWDDPWNPDPVTFPLAGTDDAISDQFLFETNIPLEMKSGDYLLVVLTVDQALNFSRTEIPITIE